MIFVAIRDQVVILSLKFFILNIVLGSAAWWILIFGQKIEIFLDQRFGFEILLLFLSFIIDIFFKFSFVSLPPRRYRLSWPFSLRFLLSLDRTMYTFLGRGSFSVRFLGFELCSELIFTFLLRHFFPKLFANLWIIVTWKQNVLEFSQSLLLLLSQLL